MRARRVGLNGGYSNSGTMNIEAILNHLVAFVV